MKELHEQLCDDARVLIGMKGHDYNSQSQKEGDTLLNLRLARMAGLVPSDAYSVLIRLGDKISRLVSLADLPPEVKNESIRDTVLDTINYSAYVFVFTIKGRVDVSLESLLGYHEALCQQAYNEDCSYDIFHSLKIAPDPAKSVLYELVAEYKRLCDLVNGKTGPGVEVIKQSVMSMIRLSCKLYVRRSEAKTQTGECAKFLLTDGEWKPVEPLPGCV